MRYKTQILNKTEAATIMIESVVKGISGKQLTAAEAVRQLKEAAKRLNEAESLIEAE